MAQFARQTLAGGSFAPQGIERAEKFGQNVLQTYDQIASFYVADGNGQFLMVLRTADGGTETKLITIAPDGARRVRLIRHDAIGQIVNEQEVTDDFDPRTRPWYRGAVNARGLYMTDVYAFFTERTPGITTALPFIAEDGRVAAVYGVDITLAALSEFLKGIDIGTTGRAMIIDAEGRLIAFPEPEQILRDDNGVLVTRRLDELGDLALARGHNWQSDPVEPATVPSKSTANASSSRPRRCRSRLARAWSHPDHGAGTRDHRLRRGEQPDRPAAVAVNHRHRRTSRRAPRSPGHPRRPQRAAGEGAAGKH